MLHEFGDHGGPHCAEQQWVRRTASNQTQKTHTRKRDQSGQMVSRDSILTVPLLNCTSSLDSTEQLKPEVLKLFGKGFCNWLCKDVIPLEQTCICRYKLFDIGFLRASLRRYYRRDQRPLYCGFSYIYANQTGGSL